MTAFTKSITDETCYVGLEGQGFVPVRDDGKETTIRCPYGVPGDRLWVRESFYAYGHWIPIDTSRAGKRQKYKFIYNSNEIRFDPPEGFRKGRNSADPSTPAWHKRNSLFMPRWASRITLEITGVRVERLQEISHRDALAEGVEYDVSKPFGSPLERFQKLWKSINGEGSWAENPYVRVVEFRRP